MCRLDTGKASKQLHELTLQGQAKHQTPQLTSRPSVPKLAIVLMCTGTRGDVQPFMVRSCLHFVCVGNLYKLQQEFSILPDSGAALAAGPTRSHVHISFLLTGCQCHTSCDKKPIAAAKYPLSPKPLWHGT